MVELCYLQLIIDGVHIFFFQSHNHFKKWIFEHIFCLEVNDQIIIIINVARTESFFVVDCMQCIYTDTYKQF